MRLSRALAPSLVVVLALVAPAGASAAVTVTTEADEGPGSLRETIANAPPGETVVVPAGTYTLTGGQIETAKSLQIEGAGAGKTAVRAGGLFRIFRITGAGNAVTLSGMTLRDGHPTAPMGVAYGGAVNVAAGASLILRNAVVTENTVDVSGGAGQTGGIGGGGGIGVESGFLAIFDSSIDANTVRAAGGAGKTGGNAFGGAIYAYASGVTIERSVIDGNAALTPGGQGPSNPAQKGGLGEGGGVYIVDPSSEARLVATTVASNRAESSGGPGGESRRAEGGGIYVSVTASSAAVVTSELTVAANSIFDAGTGSGGGQRQGGGIYAALAGAARLDLTAATIAGNTVQDGAGGNVFATGALTNVADTIVAGGSASTGANCNEPLQSQSFNLESADECGFHGNGDRVDTDPQLGPLQDNGGPGPTLLPGFGSPAIDQGAAFGLTTDARGVRRPIDFPQYPSSAAAGADGSDIGAVEVQPSAAFRLGKLNRNKKKGIARLKITFPLPTFGTVYIFGKGLKKKRATVTADGSVPLRVVTKGGARKQLRKRGKRKVRVKVKYAPSGIAASTVARTIKLVKKKRKRRGR